MVHPISVKAGQLSLTGFALKWAPPRGSWPDSSNDSRGRGLLKMGSFGKNRKRSSAEHFVAVIPNWNTVLL